MLVEASKMNGPKNKYDRTIDLIDVQSGKRYAQRHGHLGDGDYAWMPDSRASFSCARSTRRSRSSYRYTLAGGTIVQFTRIKQGVSSPVVSHDGDRIALSVTDKDPDHTAYIDFAKAGFTPSRRRRKPTSTSSITLFFESNGQGYIYQDHPHIWTIAADGSNSMQVTSGQYWPRASTGGRPTIRLVLFDSRVTKIVDSGVNDVYTMPSTGGDEQKMASPIPAN